MSALPLLRRRAARCGTRVSGAERVIGKPVPDLALPEQCDTEITAHLERLAIRSEAHQGAIDLAVARVHDRSALVSQSVSLHPPDERQALHRPSLIGALTLVADPIRVLTGLEEDFGEGAFEDSIALRDLEPAFGLAGPFVGLFPKACGRRLGGAQRQGPNIEEENEPHNHRSWQRYAHYRTCNLFCVTPCSHPGCAAIGRDCGHFGEKFNAAESPIAARAALLAGTSAMGVLSGRCGTRMYARLDGDVA